jgi:hypothetical protein
LPHSEIFGSKPVRGSPKLIAAYHVLHRLSAPRHPPDTLKALDCARNQKTDDPELPLAEKFQPHVEPASADEARLRFPIRKDQFCFKHIRDLCGQAQITTGMLSIHKVDDGLEIAPEPGVALRAKPDMLPLHNVRCLRSYSASPDPRISHPRRAASRSLSSKIAFPAEPSGPRRVMRSSN